jgi:hypothetical protein
MPLRIYLGGQVQTLNGRLPADREQALSVLAPGGAIGEGASGNPACKYRAENRRPARPHL